MQMLFYTKQMYNVRKGCSHEEIMGASLFSAFSFDPSILGPFGRFGAFDWVKQHWSNNCSSIGLFPFRAAFVESRDAQQLLVYRLGLSRIEIPGHVCPGEFVPFAKGTFFDATRLTKGTGVENLIQGRSRPVSVREDRMWESCRFETMVKAHRLWEHLGINEMTVFGIFVIHNIQQPPTDPTLRNESGSSRGGHALGVSP